MHSSLDLQPPFNEIGHKWYPASGTCGAFGVLTLSGPVYAKLYFHEAAEIDRVIAGLTALRAEMTEMPGAGDAGCAREGGHPGQHAAGALTWTGGTSVSTEDDEPAEVSCSDPHPQEPAILCARQEGHEGWHVSAHEESWEQKADDEAPASVTG